MKIAISLIDKNIESNVDQRFGRCKYFMIYDSKKQDYDYVENQGAIQGHGAGIRASQQLGELGINVAITGELGPNATNVLNQLGIKAYHANGKVREVISNFEKDDLSEINSVSQAHSGLNESSNNINNANDANNVENTNSNQNNNTQVEKIFFPILDDEDLNSKISEHFGHAPFFGLYNTQTNELKIIPNDLEHTNPNLSPIDQIQQAVNPTTIYAKGIGSRAIQIINQKNLKLKTGNYNTIKEVLQNLENLEELTQDCGHAHEN